MGNGITGKLYGVGVIAGRCDDCGEIKEYDNIKDGDEIPNKWVCSDCKQPKE